MKKEFHYFLTALMYYTRIPVPLNIGHGTEMLNKATRYFPLIGYIIATIVGATFYLAQLVLPQTVSIILGIAAGIFATGAFHEDGFADTCDGFGGGWTKSKILDIMKDSRVGTFGMVGLSLVLLLKLFSLTSMPWQLVIMAVFVAHPLSRWLALTVVYSMQYVRENEDSKAKPIAKGMTHLEFTFASFFAFLPLAAMIYYFNCPALLLVMVPLFLARWYFVRLMRKWIGGYTGDCLGALQQAAETIIYLFFCYKGWQFIL
ncbi:adenosylcobinamide-GDP ribazoletransferase [Chitinophaga caeni]|uniref:Adenosylcobinamide-GDP ribazoletransferase n=1 Tax=Chitinophaga caeni TaxID=2029983 RepID=A0A291QQJ8_9BACT|nr:adenosylcobinamide-GDP ribazoletransferase [Chitinophaga caeni]ATL46230.1 adenosylcobinamide-GDP ribazoletransferase [Chitinophaga caeni]